MEVPDGSVSSKPRIVVRSIVVLDGAPEGWKTIKASPGLEDLWQLHFAVANGKEANVPDAFIANVDEQCQGLYLKVSASENGSFTVYNPRNKFMKTYAAK